MKKITTIKKEEVKAIIKELKIGQRLVIEKLDVDNRTVCRSYRVVEVEDDYLVSCHGASDRLYGDEATTIAMGGDALDNTPINWGADNEGNPINNAECYVLSLYDSVEEFDKDQWFFAENGLRGWREYNFQ